MFEMETSNRVKRDDCTLIVSSCDRYRDLWEPYFNLKATYWPDCPFNTVLISESLKTNIPGVTCLPSGRGLSWSEMLKNTVREVKTPYVLLSMEDFFLRSPVDTKKVLDLLEYMKNVNVNMLRLIQGPGDKFIANGVELRRIPRNAKYRVSGQAAFWKSSVLIDLLVDTESLWEFEENGSVRARTFNEFIAVNRPVLPYRHHVVERGRWFPWNAYTFSRMNIGVDLSKREVMSFKVTFIWLLNKLFGPVATRLPKKIRVAVKPFLQKLSIVD